MRLRPLLVLLALASSVPAAHAQPAPAVRARGELEAARRDSSADAAAVRRDIQSLQTRLVQLASVQATGELATGSKRTRLLALNGQESELTARLGRNRNTLARLLGALELYRRDPPPALLVHPNSAKDAVRAAILVRAMAPELQRRGRALGAEAVQIQKLRRDVAAASEDLFQADSNLAEKRAQIEGLITRKIALERSLMGDASAADQALSALARDASSVDELGLRLGLASHTQASAPAKGSFLAPVSGPVVKLFGAPMGRGRSEGWTYRTVPGALVRAPAAGVVEYSGPLQGYGVILILRVGGGYHLVFTGLETAQAVAGGSVEAGEPVGTMAKGKGPEGAQRSPELYVEIRKEGAPVDPAPWLRAAAPGARASG